MLETDAREPRVLDAWLERVQAARQELRWPDAPAVALAHAAGASLALSAPIDQLFTATEVNEWALAASLADREPASAEALIAALALEQPEESELPVLEEAGGTLDDLVMTTTYIVDAQYREGYNEVRMGMYKKDPPTSTLVIVKGLAHPDYLIEIAGIAIL